MSDAARTPPERLAEQLRIEREARRDAEAVAERALADLARARGDAVAETPFGAGLLADVDHDLRTPLNVIIGLTEALLRGDPSERQREHLRTVMESGESLLAVVEDLLELAKIEGGVLELARRELDLHEVVATALAPLAPLAERKGLELVSFVEPGLVPTRLGDPERLARVISTLAADAIQHTGRGEVVVRVERDDAEGAAGLAISVGDARSGDAPGLEGGHGLERALCRRLIGCLGGTLRSERGRDAGHVARFAARLAPAAAEPAARAPELASDDARVLIVDASATRRSALLQVIRAAGLRPDAVASPAEALAALEEGFRAGDPVRLMVIDVRGKSGEGIALAQRVRRDTRHFALDFVFLTPVDPDVDLARCDALLGARVAKPVDPRELIGVMARFLGHAFEAAPAPGRDEAAAVPALSPALRLVLADGQEIALRDDGAEVRIGERRILLLEDSVPNQKVARAMLGGRYTVVVAGTGREALALLAEQRFDVALLDVETPDLSGLEVAAAVRAAEADTGAHLPMIAMTAHTLEGDRERCLEAGMDDYIAKPVRRDELLAAIARGIDFGDGSGGPGEGDAASPAQGLLDWTGPRSRAGDGADALRALVEANLAELREHKARLPGDVAAASAVEVGRRARALKALMRLYGAIEPYRLVRELEEAVGGGFAPDAASRVDAVARALVPVESELTRFLDAGAPSAAGGAD